MRTPAGRLKSRHRKRDVGLRRRLVQHSAEVHRGTSRAVEAPFRERKRAETGLMAFPAAGLPAQDPARASPPDADLTVRHRLLPAKASYRRGTRPRRTVRAGGLRVVVAANHSLCLPTLPAWAQPPGPAPPRVGSAFHGASPRVGAIHPDDQRGAAAWRAAMASRRVWISSRLIQRPRAITPAMRCRLASSASGSASSSSRSARRPTATVPNASLR